MSNSQNQTLAAFNHNVAAVILTFGKFKNRPMREVDQGYLEWMVHGAKQGKRSGNLPYRKGTSWEVLAELELARRGITPINSIVSDGQDSAVINIDDDAYVPTESRSVTQAEVKTAADFKTRVHPAVIDAASRSNVILKEFLLRTDKSFGLYTWLADLTKEAIQLGTRSWTEAFWGDTVKYEYMRLVFSVNLKAGCVTLVNLELAHYTAV